jgi:hypothetical protein
MMKILVVLMIGLAAGYHLGFKDARQHRTTVVTRMIEQVGGSSRGKYANDIDRQMERQEK